ncbi:SAM-dependent methyltransferase [Lottiidibacillus patelloidae]|uniref:SAM-dependent methyltransferase n=1 Tax=Lottiidibacillus patelloidae TaxID=2670334 RepID=A0A263BV37_9BACI|nr:SAM-dependent methyltransferase [Lottiidibacillus patelloidae]OZM57584.1 SAM-dependent methyltransferase [Lottiidibacillus patelloidae]
MIINNDEIKIVIGAGQYNNNPGWIQTQENELNLLNEKSWKDKYKENSISAILAEHVWEHLTYEEGVQAAKICYKFLKPSGYIRCAVPDGYFRNEEYQIIVRVGGPGPKDHPAASHKIVHNYKTLTEMFEEAGFEVKMLEYFDEAGDFHENTWDGKEGVIFRSKKFDPRNQEELLFPSIIIDAVKK